MTAGHFVPVLGKKGDRNYIPAETVTTDDYVFVAESGESYQLVPSKVINISVEAKLGYYSPLTTTGYYCQCMIVSFTLLLSFFF